MKGPECDVLDEGDMVWRVPVQAVPVLGEGDAVHHRVNRADHLEDPDAWEDLDDEDSSPLPRRGRIGTRR